MDADCLIKLTKAGLKELVGTENDIIIPDVVRKEIVDAGKIKGAQDAFIVEKNIVDNMIKVADASFDYIKGDQALAALFPTEDFDAVATDDTKLTHRLRMYGIPFILPCLIIFQLFKDEMIDKKMALWALDQLAQFVSEDEFSTVKILVEKTK